MQFSYKSKFILLFILFGIFVVAGSLMAYYVIESKNVKKDFLDNASTIISIKQDRFRQFVTRTNDAVTSLSQNILVKQYVKNRRQKALFESVVTMVATSNPDFLTFGFVTVKGNQLFRYERNSKTGKLAAVGGKLPRYRDTACIEATLGLQEKKVRFSTARTVIGGIEYPAIKVSTPLFIKGRLQGFVYVEANMRALIDSMQKSSVGFIHLTDGEGKFLVYNDDLYMKQDGFDLEKAYGEMADDILFADIYVGKEMYAQTIRLGEENEFKIILQMHSDKLEKKKAELFTLSLWLIGAVALLSLPLAYLFAIIPDRLNRKVVEKSNELAELNKNLEQRVVEEVNIRREKEKMLVHQSKMASMGEMIGAIAHQWRQPLNTLSLISLGIKDYFRRGQLDEARLEHEMEKVDNQLQFMSKTIDDFRNFFKADKEKEPFEVARSIQDVLTLLSSQIVKHKIDVVFECLEEGALKASVHLDESKAAFGEFAAYVDGYKNEFKQVVLNIINNAKDAILEKAIDGKITIRVALERGKVITTIRDNGGGIPEAILERIFEPYFSTKGEHGTGVGLDMSKTIIEENMQGSITAENREGGACFTITLDQADSDEVFATEVSSPVILKAAPADIAEPEALSADAEEGTAYLNDLMEDFGMGSPSGSDAIDFIDSLYKEEDVTHPPGETERLADITKRITGLKTTFDKLSETFPNIGTFRTNRDECDTLLRELDEVKQIIEDGDGAR